MISYNKEALNQMFNDLSVLFKANLSLFDENFESTPIANFGNRSHICIFLKKYIQKKCSASDSNAIRACIKQKSSYVYECHLGFTEIVIPFDINNSSTFFVMIGPFRKEESNILLIDNLKKLCESNNLDYKDFESHLNDSTVLDDDYVKSIINIVSLLINDAIKNKLILVKDSFVENKLNPYLEKNISKQLYIGDIAKEFYYSPKQLETAIKDYSGMSPRKYILKYKIKVAKEMLLNTTNNLQQIASDVGFDDYNYFIKVFKTYAGDTPLHFRKKFKLDIF